MRDMRDTLRDTFSRVLNLENRRKSVRSGNIERIPAFASAIFGNTRDLTVYLPPGYQERESLRYPVLYMQDGQNLFDPERAYIPGQSWLLHEAADRAIASRKAAPMIIVGIDHAGVGRIDEFTPTMEPQRNAGGKADDYARLLIEEVKTMTDARFRTRPERSATAIGGSSLGGLLAMYVGLRHPEVFGAIAAMSPSVWWHDRVILNVVDQVLSTERPRIWLDIGGREGGEALQDARLLRDHLTAQGWDLRSDLRFFEDRRADHSERAWARRAGVMLEYLFGLDGLNIPHGN